MSSVDKSGRFMLCTLLHSLSPAERLFFRKQSLFLSKRLWSIFSKQSSWELKNIVPAAANSYIITERGNLKAKQFYKAEVKWNKETGWMKAAAAWNLSSLSAEATLAAAATHPAAADGLTEPRWQPACTSRVWRVFSSDAVRLWLL